MTNCLKGETKRNMALCWDSAQHLGVSLGVKSKLLSPSGQRHAYTHTYTRPAIIQLWVCFCLGDTALCPICWVIKPALLIKSFALQGGKQRTTQADWADTHHSMHIYSLVYVYLKYKATKVAYAVSAGRKMKYCWFFLKAKKKCLWSRSTKMYELHIISFFGFTWSKVWK